MKLITSGGIYVILTTICLAGCSPSVKIIKGGKNSTISVMVPTEKKLSCEQLNALWKELFLRETCFIQNVCAVTLSPYGSDNIFLPEARPFLDVLLDMDETRFSSKNAYFFAQQLVGITYYLKGANKEALLIFRKLSSFLMKTSIPDEARHKFYLYYALAALQSISSEDFAHAVSQCKWLPTQKNILLQIAHLVDEIKKGEEKDVVSQIEKITSHPDRKKILLLLVKKLGGKDLSLSEVNDLAGIAAKYNLSDISSLWEFCLGKEEAVALFAGVDVQCKE
jgi:hypothetical protein